MSIFDYLKIEMSFQAFVAEDAARQNQLLASFSMYGEVDDPKFAAVWLPVPTQVRPRLPPHLLGVNETPQPVLLSNDAVTHVGITGAGIAQGFRIALVQETFPTPIRSTVLVTHKSPEPAESYPRVVGLDYCAETFPNFTSPFGVDPPQRVRRTYVLATQKRASGDDLTRYHFHHMNVVDGPTGIAAQPEHRATLNGWARAHHAIPDPLKIDGRRTVLVNYRDETFEPWPANMKTGDMSLKFRGGTPVWGPLRRFHLKQTLDDLAAELPMPVWPIAVGANGTGSNARFCVTFGRKDKVDALARKFFVVVDGIETPPKRVGAVVYREKPGQSAKPKGPAQTAGSGGPGQSTAQGAQLQALLESWNAKLAQLDAAMKSSMKKNGIRCATLVVGRNGRLPLARTYTLAEKGYPVATNFDKFRWGSCAKFLCGMRACIPFTTDQAQDDWLASSAATAYGISDDDIEAAPGTSQQKSWFRAVTVADLLLMESGFIQDGDVELDDPDPCGGPETFDYDKAVFKAKGNRLPLEPGDLRELLRKRGPELMYRAPTERWCYSNPNTNVVAELISRKMTSDYKSYLPEMRQWWGFDRNSPRVAAIGPNRNACFAQGEVITHGSPGWAHASLVPTSSIDYALAHPTPGAEPDLLKGLKLAPARYGGGDDSELLAGSGFLVMTGPTFARIMSGLHPGAPPPVKQLVKSTADFERLERRNTEVVSLASTNVTKTQLHSDVLVTLFKNGNIGGGYSWVKHTYWDHGPDGMPRESLTVAACSNVADNGVGGLTKVIDDLEQLDYWRSAHNLFPDFE